MDEPQPGAEDAANKDEDEEEDDLVRNDPGSKPWVRGSNSFVL